MKSLFILPGICLLALSGCRTPHAATTDNREAVTYLALGDSYTIGESVSENERYPVQLAAVLEQEDIPMAEPEIIARTGWTTTELQRGITDAAIAGKTYGLVTLLIGVNNAFRGYSETEYATEFTELLRQAIAFAGGKKEHVFVLSIPDYGYTPYGKEQQTEISPRIDRFNAINRRITDSLGVHYTDITPISRKGLKDIKLVASDGLHPSGKMYALWVQELKRTVKKHLED